MITTGRKLRTPAHYGEEIHESEEQRAERLLKTLLKNKTETRPPSAPPAKVIIKIKLAQQLPEQTTMTIRWIAARLQMGTPDHLCLFSSQRRNSPLLSSVWPHF